MALASGTPRILKAVKCLYAVSILKYLGEDAKNIYMYWKPNNYACKKCRGIDWYSNAFLCLNVEKHMCTSRGLILAHLNLHHNSSNGMLLKVSHSVHK